MQADDRFQQGRFSRTIRADQGDTFPLTNFDVDTGQNGRVTSIELGQVSRADNAFTGRRGLRIFHHFEGLRERLNYKKGAFVAPLSKLDVKFRTLVADELGEAVYTNGLVHGAYVVVVLVIDLGEEEATFILAVVFALEDRGHQILPILQK